MSSTNISVSVLPAAKKNHVKAIGENRYEVRLKAKPEHNQANVSLIEILATYFHLPTQAIHILTGHHSSHKRLEINQ